jgi:precorrin-6Y C5,15-methyltransferase (decarboxylating)
MSEPWLAIVGLGEDGLAGLATSSRDALEAAEVVFGAPRHLDLAGIGSRGQAWPIPFDLAPLLALRGHKRVAMLVSGDPFWFGAGGSVAAHLSPGEWRAFPVAGVFSLIAARLGWRLEECLCLGLHAAPHARLRPVLARGVRVIATLRDGAAVAELAAWLQDNGFAEARLTVCEAVGGPRERLRVGAGWRDVQVPVAVAIDGADLPRDACLPRGFGLPDDLFQSDGQITKSSIRALTLSALAPRPEEVLWDIGAGSGSVSVEWCLAGGRSICLETRADRVANIRANAEAFGIAHRLTALHATAPAGLSALPAPDAVFVGGGGDAALHAALWPLLPEGARIVANGVTIETESVLADLHASHGGSLLRFDMAEATTLGRFRDWRAARPVVQWRGVK